MDVVIDNGQPLLALTPQEWQEAFRNCQLLGRPISAIFRHNSTEALAYAAQYPELCVYVGDVDGHFFLPQVILQIQGYAQRVFLERLTCGICSWSGMSAEPFSLDNYLLLPEETRSQLIRNVGTLPQAPCPRCGAKLPRRSVWTEYA